MSSPGDQGALSPLTPPPQSQKELRANYIAKAKRNDALRGGNAHAPFRSHPKSLGSEYGLGLGLHFELMRWLRWLAFALLLFAVPFMVVIATSVFTDAAHANDHGFGVKRYPTAKIHSLTFAAIVDNSLDNGTLPYMNVEIGGSWKGPMQKATFLTWISLVDAAALLLFCVGLAGLWLHLRRFMQAMDRSTLEAADFAVLVRGLPDDVDAAQVGEHFRRYGEVMDVVLLTDRLSHTLQLCGKAAATQQRRSMVLDAVVLKQNEVHLTQLQRLDEKMVNMSDNIRKVAERRQRVRAAFVTFNSENERRACTAECPNNWLACVFQPRASRFLGTHRFWVRQASAPEDYRLEHLSVPEWQLAAREVMVNIITLFLVLVCAAAITKLTDVSNEQTRTVTWYWDKLNSNAASALRLPAISTTNATAAAARLASTCTTQLAGTCTRHLQALYGSNTVQLAYGGSPEYANSTMRLLLERPVRAALQACWEGASCPLPACLPCMCLGMATAKGDVTNNGNTQSEMCGVYINEIDIRSWGIRIAIATVVAFLNCAIKFALQGLVLLGRHWTHTARERSYALQCFVAMLINSVAVLLLTNCERLGQLAREHSGGSWVRYFVRYGAYGDFLPAWYENVGLSILILMAINVLGPLITIASDELWQSMLRCRVLHCMRWPLQADYDEAWARPRFTLEQRTADLLLNVTLALMFGSGMPLLYVLLLAYLITADLADRWALTRLTGGPPRYGKGLSSLVMGLLPWLAALHCAFGLWQHTFFKPVAPDGSAGDLGQLNAALRSTNARLSAASSDLSALQSSGVWVRITQPNGLALLLLLIGLALWLLLGRYILWHVLSCLRHTASSVCCPGASARRMQARLSRDAEAASSAVSYSDALVSGDLRGAPTYRLAHLPAYVQFFAASGLNRNVGLAALVAAAASGGAGRRTYTRLKTTHRGRGRPAAFAILPAPVMRAVGAAHKRAASSTTAADAAARGDAADADAVQHEELSHVGEAGAEEMVAPEAVEIAESTLAPQPLLAKKSASGLPAVPLSTSASAADGGGIILAAGDSVVAVPASDVAQMLLQQEEGRVEQTVAEWRRRRATREVDASVGLPPVATAVGGFLAANTDAHASPAAGAGSDEAQPPQQHVFAEQQQQQEGDAACAVAAAAAAAAEFDQVAAAAAGAATVACVVHAAGRGELRIVIPAGALALASEPGVPWAPASDGSEFDIASGTLSMQLSTPAPQPHQLPPPPPHEEQLRPPTRAQSHASAASAAPVGVESGAESRASRDVWAGIMASWTSAAPSRASLPAGAPAAEAAARPASETATRPAGPDQV